MNILFVTSEAVPFAKSGGLADVAGALPKAMKRLGVDMRVIMPFYKSIKEKYETEFTFVGYFDTKVAWRDKYCGVFMTEYEGVTYYFIDNDEYFGRDRLYGYADDGERFTYFSRAVLDAIGIIDFEPDILHCNEHQSALVPIYIKTMYRDHPTFKDMRTVFSIHNIEYQGKYDKYVLGDLFGLGIGDMGLVEYGGCINLMKGAIVACDKLTTVSPKYAEELKYRYYGRGLENIIEENSYKLRGILNGIDNYTWNPWFDKNVPVRYSLKSIQKKEENKKELLSRFGINPETTGPVIAMVTRLTEHKGLDLVMRVFHDIMRENVSFVLLGSGEEKYERFFNNAAAQYPGRVGAITTFSPELSSLVYAGADLFLMPSLFEPCGLAQMIAAKYGTIPIVRSTGGLHDSIIPYNPEEKTGNGVTFLTIHPEDMFHAVRRAVELYYNKEEWKQVVENAMNSDFSWKNGAKEYLEIYNDII